MGLTAELLIVSIKDNNTMTKSKLVPCSHQAKQCTYRQVTGCLYFLLVVTLLLYLPSNAYCQMLNSRISERESVIPHHGRCEPITIQLCKDIRYNETIMPNLLGHQKQEEAGQDVHQFFPLVKVQCSPDLQFFLCSMYAPVCTILEKAIPPCRSLCQSARLNCEELMVRFGFRWPENLECSKFPEAGGEELCVGETGDHHNAEASGTHRPLTQMNGFMPSFKIPVIKKTPSIGMNITKDLGFSCPAHFKTPPGLDYVFRVYGKEHKNCGVPCDGVLFRNEERKSIRIWTGMWAIVCVLSTTFTVLTFSIDTSRFKYPERPIIFLSLCYLCIGLVYSTGFFLGDKVACNEPFTSPEHNNIQMVPTITQGNKKESCTLLFMALYFFTISSSIWWVILTMAWFLAAGLKWGSEAIENNAHIFHLFGWAVPAVMTITVLAMGKVEGDVLTGVCFVGVFNQSALKYFVFYPSLICLLVGFFFLLAGFVSLWHVRTIMKKDGTKTDKLEKLMLRIGFFAVLYICPTFLLLACYYYEQTSLDSWILSWQSEVCQRKEYAIPCPLLGAGRELRPAKPYFSVFLLKYVATVMAGITSGFWIWSEKTINSWSKFYAKLCCRVSRNETFV
ncbi:Frizzled-1 [Halotydeus destructor]|nr:Frizzled-1 [Halotydeus destructor]